MAVELRSDRCHQILSRAIFNQVDNLGILCGNAVEIMSCVFPLSSVGQIFINHPQPPEHIDRGKADVSQNEGTHLLTASFFKLLHQSLTPGGTVTIVTDNQSYARLLLRIVSCSAASHFDCGDVTETSTIREDYSIEPSSCSGEARSTYTGDCSSSSKKFKLFRGDPDASVGHIVHSSSYFDRMWTKGEHSRRWILYLMAK